ncbi:hypothetical protein CRUP_024891 [Coryphaenoides rupestris]|nr:hypothetical protein CRUP_024891 [Coryphaenoides rupestris]
MAGQTAQQERLCGYHTTTTGLTPGPPPADPLLAHTHHLSSSTTDCHTTHHHPHQPQSAHHTHNPALCRHSWAPTAKPRSAPHTQLLSHSWDTHCGSQERYREMVKRVQIPRSPNQLYRLPLTESQRYGWMVSKDDDSNAWTQIKRFPRKNSEMTKFVRDMSLTDPDFTLF